MDIQEPNRDYLMRRSDRLDQLVNVWKAFRTGAGDIRSDRYSLEGVDLSEVEDALKLTISYRWIGIEFVFSTYSDDKGLKGRVTAILSKHPLDESRPVLGTFDLTWDGMTNVVVDGRVLGAEKSAPWVVAAAIEEALSLGGPPKPKVGVFA